jgi:hypothetical protein
MGSTWGLLKRIAEKRFAKKDERRPISDRIDLNLPLGIRINGIVEVPQVDFILGGENLKIKHPGNSNIVLSMGRFLIGDSTIRRFYLDAGEVVYTLQIIADKKGSIEECKLFMPFDEVYPNEEGWDFWLNEREGYIGYNVFQTKDDNTQYERVWEDEGAIIQLPDGFNRIPPVSYTERIYLDPYGDSVENVQYDSMLYGRHATADVDEYLLVSAVQDSGGASVQVAVGIPLEPASLKVI